MSQVVQRRDRVKPAGLMIEPGWRRIVCHVEQHDDDRSESNTHSEGQRDRPIATAIAAAAISSASLRAAAHHLGVALRERQREKECEREGQEPGRVPDAENLGAHNDAQREQHADDEYIEQRNALQPIRVGRASTRGKRASTPQTRAPADRRRPARQSSSAVRQSGRERSSGVRSRTGAGAWWDVPGRPRDRQGR